MSIPAILSLIRAHNLPCYTVGNCVVAEETLIHCETREITTQHKAFPAGTHPSVVLAWLGY